ncbi:hypothetical protein ACZ87_01318 [Candidatus Erwinia dacicola]|uniref:Uncharacterized protein n=1 Tax=Candidatus Erwinia dacicola TaxID=252393 RepID=A0A328TVN8_9GAMM|nr:hypothetical protein ACZ87_01318 [Candidatus Erwinia dacicola]
MSVTTRVKSLGATVFPAGDRIKNKVYHAIISVFSSLKSFSGCVCK